MATGKQRSAARDTLSSRGYVRLIVTIVWLSWALPAYSASASLDVPFRRSPWLEDSMDDKTCEIVQLHTRPAGSAEKEADISGLIDWTGTTESVVAVVWGEERGADVFDSLETWPVLHFSVGSKPYALALQSTPFAVTNTTVHEARAAELTWSDPQSEATATLRMSPPEAFQDDGSGDLKLRSRAPRADAVKADLHEHDVPRLEVTRWRGELNVTTKAGTWKLSVVVQSLCG